MLRGDRVSGQALRITLPVISFLVRMDNFRRALKKFYAAHQFISDLRMLLHDFPFAGGQLAGLEQDGIGSAYFSDVVKISAAFDMLQLIPGAAHPFGQFKAIARNPMGMSRRLVIPQVQAAPNASSVSS